MNEPTGQPTAEQVAALRVLAEHMARRATAATHYPDEYVLAHFMSYEEADRQTLVAGMTTIEDVRLIDPNAGMYRWAGDLLGMPLRVLGYPGDEPTAVAAQPEPTPPPTGSTWRNCGHRADYASAAEHDRDCPAHADTDPATAAAEKPAGPVAHWPINAPSVPRQRQRRAWLDRGVPAPGESSWARVGFEAALRPHAPGLVPLTDPALLGRTDEVA